VPRPPPSWRWRRGGAVIGKRLNDLFEDNLSRRIGLTALGLTCLFTYYGHLPDQTEWVYILVWLAFVYLQETYKLAKYAADLAKE
jgi:hypothetical protein